MAKVTSKKCSNHYKRHGTGSPIEIHTYTPQRSKTSTAKDPRAHSTLELVCPFTMPEEIRSYCIGTSCAWYDINNDCCAILAIPKVLTRRLEYNDERLP